MQTRMLRLDSTLHVPNKLVTACLTLSVSHGSLVSAYTLDVSNSPACLGQPRCAHLPAQRLPHYCAYLCARQCHTGQELIEPCLTDSL